ncbi:MAG TPA: P-loop NTPase [Candidatus Lumbricidophila sp.]|nr:P-loop NTPase [Candidatus Lumbricidophila sp.]
MTADERATRRERVVAALAAVIDPEIRRPITELDMVGDVDVAADGAVRVTIKLTIVGCPASDRIERDVRDAALGALGTFAARVPAADEPSSPVAVDLTVMSPAERAALTEKLRGGRANRTNPFGPGTLTQVIAISSGKGGVGKSTLTANLAVALAALGRRVGLIDADVHGYSIPGILGMLDADGIAPRPTRVDDLILPPVAHGVKVVSIGMFVPPSADGTPAAVSWRGPMLHRTLSQFITEVYFGDLDVLIVDLPPGTGDVAISFGQLLPNAEVVVVTTPQRAAADVAERSAVVARQTGQRVIGVIENMAGFTAPDGTVIDIFGAGGGAEVATRLSVGQDAPVPVLGSIPLSPALRAAADAGEPVVLADPDDPAARVIREIAERLASRPRDLAGRKLDLSPR